MKDRRTRERYRGHDLVIAEVGSRIEGRAWAVGGSAFEANGANAEAVAATLRTAVDDALARTDPVEQFRCAFRALATAGRADSDWAMLRAHYKAPGRIITAAELAVAVGFPGHATVNLRYGLLSKALYEQGLLALPADAKYPNGKPIYTFVIAEGERLEGENWRWTMRETVATAMKSLGLDR